MPVYNRGCESCAWETDFAFEPMTDPSPACPECGGSTRRFLGGRGATVIPDTYSTPIVDSVMTAKRQIFETRSDRNRAMKHNRLQEFIKWTPGNESDKSSLVQRQETMSRYTLESWSKYFLEKYPLTDDEKSTIAVTDAQ